MLSKQRFMVINIIQINHLLYKLPYIVDITINKYVLTSMFLSRI